MSLGDVVARLASAFPAMDPGEPAPHVLWLGSGRRRDVHADGIGCGYGPRDVPRPPRQDLR